MGVVDARIDDGYFHSGPSVLTATEGVPGSGRVDQIEGFCQVFFVARHALHEAYAGKLAKLSGFGVTSRDKDSIGDDVHRAEDGDFAGGKSGLDSGLGSRSLGASSAAAGLGELGARVDSFGG